MKALNLLYRLKHIFLPIVLICLIVFIEGCDSRKTAPPSRTPEVAIMHIKTEKVAITAELPGRTSAYLTAEVRPQVRGIVQKRLFEEGADVKENEVLYVIKPELYQALYNKSKSALSKAEAAIIPLRYKFERNKTLIKSNSISQQDYERSEADLYTAQADIDAYTAVVERARINLDYTNVRAPISGRIGRSDVTVGALVTEHNPTPLATIQQINPIFIDVVQSSADLLRFKQDIAEGFIKKIDEKKLKAKLYFEDGSLYPMEGEMKFRDISVDQCTGSFIMRIVFPNPDYALLPGMYVRVIIEIGIVENAILVPHQAVSRDMKGNPVIYVVDTSDKVEERSIVTDRSIGDRWLVKEGLKTGERLIVEGFQRIRPGITVKVVDFSPKVKNNGTESDSNISPDNQKK